MGEQFCVNGTEPMGDQFCVNGTVPMGGLNNYDFTWIGHNMQKIHHMTISQSQLFQSSLTTLIEMKYITLFQLHTNFHHL